MNSATRQLERIGEGLEQAATLTRRAGDALDEMSRSLLRAAEQMKTNSGRTTTGRTAARRRTSVATRRTVRSTGNRTERAGEELRGVGT